VPPAFPGVDVQPPHSLEAPFRVAPSTDRRQRCRRVLRSSASRAGAIGASAFLLLIGLSPVVGQDPDTGADIQYVLAEGQITDGMGAGIAGVTVVARPAGNTDGDPVAETTTDALGDFLLIASKQHTGTLKLTFTKEMFDTLVREVEVAPGKVPFVGETMHGDLTVTGRVTNAIDESPVAGANVVASTYDDAWRATTGADGRFELTGVSPGPGEVTVTAAGFGREHDTVGNFADVRELALPIKPERVVEIKVVDEQGDPVKGVVVEVYDRARDDLRNFVTDGEGEVTVSGIHFDAEVLALRLSRKGYVSDVGFARALTLPRESTESTHREVMRRAGRIVGAVTDARTGGPLHGARVMTGGTYTEDSPRDWSDRRGVYEIHGVKPGPVVVTVHMDAHAPELRVVEVAAGGKRRADFELAPGQTVTGLVKDENGDPVHGLTVRADEWRGHTTLGLRAVTGHDGRFIIEDAPADEFEVTAAPQTGEPVTHVVTGASGETPAFVFPVKPVGADAPRGAEGLRVGDAAPTFEVTTLNDAEIDTADHTGKVILLDFWATWCAPCLDEMPHLLEVWEKYGKRDDFLMLGLSRDFDKPSCQNYLRANPKLDWPHAVGTAGGVEKAVRLFGVTWIPRVYLIDRKGKVAAKNVRGMEVMSAVSKLLDDKQEE